MLCSETRHCQRPEVLEVCDFALLFSNSVSKCGDLVFQFGDLRFTGIWCLPDFALMLEAALKVILKLSIGAVERST